MSALGLEQSRQSSRMEKSEETVGGRKAEGGAGREVRGPRRSSTSSLEALDNLLRNNRRALVPCSYTGQGFRLLNLDVKRKGAYRRLGNLGVLRLHTKQAARMAFPRANSDSFNFISKNSLCQQRTGCKKTA